MQTTHGTRAPAALAAIVALGGLAHSQVAFSIDDDGASIGFPSAFMNVPINEGDVLNPAAGGPVLGPLKQPAVLLSGGPLGLAIPTYPFSSEVDAFSSGFNVNDFNIPPEVLQWRSSVDEFSIGIAGVAAPPTVDSEGAIRALEASGDAFIPLMTLPGPLPPFAAPPDHVGTLDGNGFRSASGFGYPGLGLLEWNPPGAPPGLGDNIDGLETLTPFAFQFYFSLEGPLVDPITGIAGSGSAAANGFVGGDVLISPGGGLPPTLYASAFSLGLDLFFGPDTDDLDALIVWENGDFFYQPSQQPYDWLTGGTDMLLFSVRRGSALIGFPDAFFGVPIEEGDILYPIFGSPPGIWYAAENLGLRTFRNFGPGPFGSHGDDLDAVDIADVPVLDCDFNGFEDAWDVAFGGASDCNLNGIPDACDIASGNSSDVSPTDGVPDECQCGAVSTYCVAKVNSLGCTPIIWSQGTPCATCTAPYTIDAVNIVSAKNGLLFYGYGPAALPFLGGTLCVQPPLRRTPIMNSGGVFPPNTCSGTYTFDMNGRIASNVDPLLVPGATVYAQYWHRDPPHPDGTGVGLTDAVSFTICP